MKPIRQQLKEALVWKGRFWSLRDFTLTVMAGFAIPFGVLFWMGGDSVRSPFDLKVAVGCFVLGGVCVLLAANSVFVLGCAVMVPAALVWFDAVVTRNQKALAFCFVDLAFGSLILILGTLARSVWQLGHHLAGASDRFIRTGGHDDLDLHRLNRQIPQSD
jgi:hypothetical protein